MIIGAPNSAVTALIGSVPGSPGSWEIRSHTSIIIDPQQMEPNNTIRWFDVLNMPLAMCGVVIPIKAIGPVKAVVVPASSAVNKMTKMRSLLTEKPNPWA